MNNHEEKKIELVESLIEEKAFEELSKWEELLVLEVIGSSADYTRMKALNRQLSDRENLRTSGPEPDPQILADIKKVFFSKPRRQFKSKKWRAVFEFKLHVPAYQMGLATLLLILSFVFFKTPKESIEQFEPELVQKIVHDTITIQAERDTVYIEKYVFKEVESKPRPTVALKESINTVDTENITNVEDYLSMVNNQKGFSLKEKEYLLNLSVGDD